MGKRIIFVAILSFFTLSSTSAQTANFRELVKTGTPLDVQAAITKGADVNAQDKDESSTTPLMLAAAFNPNPEVITILINAGADIQAQSGDGFTALMCAAANNKNPEMITILINAGADIQAQSGDGFTALMCAVNNQNPEGITTLLKAGADAKAKSKEGKTAFNYAQDNEKLKDTNAYWALSDAQY